MSKLEAMAYKMQPAGHEEPAPRRKYEKHSRLLGKLFTEYLDKERPTHGYYANLLEKKSQKHKIKVTIEEAHALLVAHKGHPQIKYAGDFISVLYNLQPEKHIIFDVDVDPLVSLGTKLPRDKILVTLKDTGQMLGWFANGTVLNYANTGPNPGSMIKGLLINYAQSKPAADMDGTGVIINLGITEFAHDWGVSGYRMDYANCDRLEVLHIDQVLRESDPANQKISFEKNKQVLIHLKKDTEKTIPKLQEYLQSLKEKLEPGRNDYKKAIEIVESLGENLASKITKELDAILKEAGHNV